NVNGTYQVKGRRLAASGQPLGPVFSVAPSRRLELFPDVAMAAGGSFVVTYATSYSGQTASGGQAQLGDAYAVLFHADGARLRTLTVARSTPNDFVNRTSLAASANGRFVVAVDRSMIDIAANGTVSPRGNSVVAQSYS